MSLLEILFYMYVQFIKTLILQYRKLSALSARYRRENGVGVQQGRTGTPPRRSVYGGLFAHDISRIRMRGACRACVHTFIADRCTNTSLLLIVFRHVILCAP